MNPSGPSTGYEGKARVFFSEEKKQKTFMFCAGGWIRALAGFHPLAAALSWRSNDA
jgi:hypothetical protein